jgi:hypothetical protein
MRPRFATTCLAALSCALGVAQMAPAQQKLTCDLGPYDLARANWMAANYLQALLNPRWEAVGFSHDRLGDAEGVGGLYFIDDQGRVIWSWAAEAEYGPVARVEAVAMAARGILRAHIPGTRGRYFFVIDGRQSIYLRPTAEGLGAYWLQDTSTPFARIAMSVGAGETWQEVRMEPRERAPEVFERESGYRTDTPQASLQVTNCSAALDRPPLLEITPRQGAGIRVALTTKDPVQHVWPNRGERMAIGEGVSLRGGRPWVLLERDDHLVRSEKTGWEDPRLWWQHLSMLMAAFDPAPDALRVEPRASGEAALVCEWHAAKSVRLRIAPFLELDPADCGYVFDAADHVARDGQFGFRPYYPVRSSNGFMAAPLGLAAGAWLLDQYHHPEAAKVRAAALEAFGAIVDAESRGYFGERVYNATIAAYYLKRIAPEAFDYDHWVRIWADREFQRCPPGWKSPPWSDTAVRTICHWRYAWLVTGDEKYKRAMTEALAEFDLPAARPIEGFMWRGKLYPFDGYDCTASAHLLGEWGWNRDPRAETLVREAGPRYFCDLGFAPYRTWTCDDLLPYYVGHSLRAVYGERKVGAARALKLDEYVGYDAEGKTWPVGRPFERLSPAP